MTPRMSRFEQAEAMPQGYLVDSRHFTSDPSALYAPGVRAVDSRQYASDPCGALSATSSGEHSRVTPCYCLGTPAAGKSAGDNPFGAHRGISRAPPNSWFRASPMPRHASSGTGGSGDRPGVAPTQLRC